MLGILTMVTLLASVIVVLTEFGSMMVSAQAQAQVNACIINTRTKRCNM
jgi:hypothetical protein